MKYQILRVNKSPVRGFKGLSFSLLVTAIVLVFPTCKNQENIFEEYIVPGGLYYPGKALEAEAYSGKERIKIEWQNSADPKVTKARIFWNNYADSVEIPINAGMKVISKIIEPLEEKEYSFRIRTYDDEGNVSIPVEVNGVAYGAFYESQLLNRSVKSSRYYELSSILKVEWGNAAISEVGIQLEYMDTKGDIRTMTVANTETTTEIADFNGGQLLYYTTYMPDSTSIDVFQALPVNFSDHYVVKTYHVEVVNGSGSGVYEEGALVSITADEPLEGMYFGKWLSDGVDLGNEEESQSAEFIMPANDVTVEATYVDMIFVNITDEVLINTHAPFEKEGDELAFQVYAIADWITNPEAAKGGNVYFYFGNPRLTFYAYDGYPSESVTNGKLYQTVELEAGTYRFDVEAIDFWGTPDECYIVAALGNDLPDVGDAENQSLDFIRVFDGFTNYSITFELSEKSTVSIGFVANLGANQWMIFEKVELFMLK